MFQYDHPSSVLLSLSRLVPVRFATTYGVEGEDPQYRERATWWQWRGRVLHHRRMPLSTAKEF